MRKEELLAWRENNRYIVSRMWEARKTAATWQGLKNVL